jgi:hypothetical protein
VNVYVIFLDSRNKSDLIYSMNERVFRYIFAGRKICYVQKVQDLADGHAKGRKLALVSRKATLCEFCFTMIGRADIELFSAALTWLNIIREIR